MLVKHDKNRKGLSFMTTKFLTPASASTRVFFMPDEIRVSIFVGFKNKTMREMVFANSVEDLFRTVVALPSHFKLPTHYTGSTQKELMASGTRAPVGSGTKCQAPCMVAVAEWHKQYREAVNAKTCSAVFLADIDDTNDEELQQVADALDTYEWGLYPSLNHGTLKPKGDPTRLNRARIAIRLDREYPAKEFPRVWQAIRTLLHNGS